MLRRDSPTPREHMSERLWMRDRMTLLHSVCHHHEFVKTSHRGSHETCSPQVLTEPKHTHRFVADGKYTSTKNKELLRDRRSHSANLSKSVRALLIKTS